MNLFQNKLYRELMELCAKNEAFYFIDQEFSGRTYRIFTYRLASYTDFLEPSALECRGHTFLLEDGEPIRITHMPMQKFFNWKENPMTMFERFENVTGIQFKEDGSLISTSVIDDAVVVKSKQSFQSEHAVGALKLIMSDLSLYGEIFALGCMGFTVNMEWCSPQHRIVVGYDKPQLVVLNIRSTLDGSYLSKNALVELGYYPSLTKAWVYDILEEENIALSPNARHDFIVRVKEHVGHEGYVVWMGNDAVKVKTDWYVTLHRAKDSINTPKKVMEAVLYESIDDLRTLFNEDQGTLDYISDIEERVTKAYNHMVEIVETFYRENKHLDQKSYAIKAKATDGDLMPLFMCLYNGKPTDYKRFALMKKNFSKFLNNN